MIALLVAVTAATAIEALLLQSPDTDYEKDLRLIRSRLKDLEAQAAQSVVKPNAQRVDLLFRCAIQTEALPDLRDAWLALAQYSPSAELGSGVAMARTRIALDLHNLREARAALGTMADIGATLPRARLGFDLAMQDGRYDEARKIAFLWVVPGAAAEDLCRLAGLAKFDGDDVRADQCFALAELQLQQGKGRFRAWVALQRGMLKFRAGDLSAARAHYLQAAESYSGWWKITQQQAELLGAEGRFDEAEALYRKLLTSEARPELEQELGDLLLFEGKAQEAKVLYRHALSNFLDSAQRGETLYLHHLSILYADGLSMPTEAVRWAKADLEVRGCAAAHDELAWAYFQAGDLPSAMRETDATLASGVKEPHLLTHAIGIYMATDHRRSEVRHMLEIPAVAALVGNRRFHAHRQ